LWINPTVHGGNRASSGGRGPFWPAMHAGGFTPRVFSPFESSRLLELGLGITNMVKRATATADELTDEELRAGAKRIERLMRRYRPGYAAFLGLTSYRVAFSRPRAGLGLQAERLGDTAVWLLPNPSGLNAHHQPRDLARLFGELRAAVGEKAIKR
jgi:TDG/mug DNA glycosylase family protein